MSKPTVNTLAERITVVETQLQERWTETIHRFRRGNHRFTFDYAVQRIEVTYATYLRFEPTLAPGRKA